MTRSLGRVLVVDDDPRVSTLLRDFLVALGYVVKTVARGLEALQLVPLFEPNVVLLDLHMPGMSGVEVLDHLRRDHPTLPVIIITGDADEELARRTLRSGAVDYMSKPFSVQVLARVVAAALTSRS